MAGLQLAVGYVEVDPRPELGASPDPIARPGGRRERPSRPERVDVVFEERPEHTANEVWVVFRGARDPISGRLGGEIVPDASLRILSIVPSLAFGLAGLASIVLQVVGLVQRGHVDLFPVIWGLVVLGFTVAWTASCGAALQRLGGLVGRESPGSALRWHPGVRWASPAPRRARPPRVPRRHR